MSIILNDYELIKSKKNGKTYAKYFLQFNKRKIYECFEECPEMLEQFLANNIDEDITEYVRYSYYDNIKGFKPYVKYN